MEHEIITRYIGQPARLPSELRAQVERAWGGEPIQLYALADLDESLTLAESWLLLSAEHVALARPSVGDAWDVVVAERSGIRAVQESPGLSSNTLVLVGEPHEAPITVVRYTQRQRGAFENIRFVLEESLAGRPVAGIAAADPDRVYADAVARPVRDAQALVAGRESAVMIRLLGYLLPYKKQLTLGLSAAAIVTLASLVPPYLAGYLLDRVVRPAQDGTLARGAASTMAWLA